MSDFHNVIVIDCEQRGLFPALPKSNKKIFSMVKDKKFDRLRLKTRYFSKEYDSNFKLLSIEPFFIDVRFSLVEKGAQLVTEYILKTGAVVRIYSDPSGINYIYTIKIPEMDISFLNILRLYDEVKEFQNTGVTYNPIIKRWYENYGILEHLLFDENILEININPPAYKTSVRIVHSTFEECTSNIYPSNDFLNYLLTRLKLSTGRPVNKAQPQIDGEIQIGNVRGRVAGIIKPFSIFGTGFSIRKHREHPWTLLLFISNKMANEMFAGFMNLIISHGRSFLVAGPRGSGKTSLLGSLLLEILPKYRLITIEDTKELPVDDYKRLGYDILPLKVRSAMLDEGMEVPFDKGLRTSLRLGDSALIVGEVRSVEARVLYEAMRIGAMSNVVGGTIHADSPYGVYDRVVNDLQVPKGSFKATDIIIIQNQIKDPSGISRKRRILQVTEVLKNWEGDPEFQDLFLYDGESDTLKPTEVLLKGKSITLQNILARTEGYSNYDNLLKDMMLRGWAKKIHIELAQGHAVLLEAQYTSLANSLFMSLERSVKPLSSEKNEAEFKDRFTSGLKEILSIELSEK